MYLKCLLWFFVGATVTKLFQTGGAYTQKFSTCEDNL